MNQVLNKDLNQEYLSPELSYKDCRLFFGDTALDELAAKFSTPLYVYNFDVVAKRVQELRLGLGSKNHLICYAVKANSSPELLKFLQKLDVGADVVSEGELLAARRANIPGARIVFSGVAKSNEEIALGLKEDILSFNVESLGEIKRIRALAKSHGRRPRISLRINPDIDAKTHPKIATGLHATKFGIDTKDAFQVAKELVNDPNLELSGVSCHIGSQIMDLTPLKEASLLVLDFANQLRSLGHSIRRIDLGGGLGVPYHPEERVKAPSNQNYAKMLAEILNSDPAQLVIEPGRSLVAECGVLITKIIEVKKTAGKYFILADAGMNDLVRPAMYDAYHHISPVWKNESSSSIVADVVGPVCETGDFFATDRTIQEMSEGALIAIQHAGAYGYSMASNYNLRAKPAEVALQRPGIVRLIRNREKLTDLIG